MIDSQRILIVDDNKNNLQVAGTILREEKYKLSIAQNSKGALEIVQNNPPDLILLDVNMPDVDGFEVCKLIKDMPDRKDIPIIFLTAHTETEYKISAFRLGGVDYITKPFVKEEVLARVATHLKIFGFQKYLEEEVAQRTKELHEEIKQKEKAEELLREYNKNLEQKVLERTREIEEAHKQLLEKEKMASLGQLISGVAHELNTPLGAISSSVGNIVLSFDVLVPTLPDFCKNLDSNSIEFMNVLIEKSQNYKKAFATEMANKKRLLIQKLEEDEISAANEKARSLSHIVEPSCFLELVPFLKNDQSERVLKVVKDLSIIRRMVSNINISSQKMIKIVFVLKAYLQNAEMWRNFESVNVVEGIGTVLSIYEGQIQPLMNVRKNFESVPNVSILSQEVQQVWVNLLHNSFYAIQTIEGKGELDISVKEDSGNILVIFTDNGVGVAPEHKEKIFTPFFTTKGHGEGVGLGLYVCKKIINRCGGEISFESEPGKTTVMISIPVAGQTDKNS